VKSDAAEAMKYFEGFQMPAEKAFREEYEAFLRKFGREPNSSDPVFFDPDSDTPAPVELTRFADEVVNALAGMGTDPAFIYAFRRTGLIVTPESERLLTAAERQAWKAALAEYDEIARREPS
jgi:hypothetical protein